MSNFMQIPVITNAGLQTVTHHQCVKCKRTYWCFLEHLKCKDSVTKDWNILKLFKPCFVLMPVKYKSKSRFLFNVTCNQKGHKHQPTRSMTKPQINVFFCCCYDQISTSQSSPCEKRYKYSSIPLIPHAVLFFLPFFSHGFCISLWLVSSFILKLHYRIYRISYNITWLTRVNPAQDYLYKRDSMTYLRNKECKEKTPTHL